MWASLLRGSSATRLCAEAARRLQHVRTLTKRSRSSWLEMAYSRSSEEHQELLAKQAVQDSTLLNSDAYRPLLLSMKIEGRDVNPVVQSMVLQGIHLTTAAWKAIDLSGRPLMRARLGKLKHLLATDAQRATAFFDQIIEGGQAAEAHLELMLRRGCSSSEEQRALIDRAAAHGVPATAKVYAPLVRQLCAEGQPVEPVLAEMSALGLVPDAQTQSLIDKATDGTVELKQLLVADAQQATAFFDEMLENGAAREAHLELMLRRGCDSSEEQRSLIDRAAAHGVPATAKVYAPLVRQLCAEGQPVEPVLAEMSALGFTPDRTTEALFRDPDALAKLRAQQLRRRLSAGDREGADAIFTSLLEVGGATAHHLSLMLSSAGRRSYDEQQRLVQASEQAGVQLDAGCLNQLLRQLRFEGKPVEALIGDFARRGIKLSRNTKRLLNAAPPVD